jgi:hypothetical protein
MSGPTIPDARDAVTSDEADQASAAVPSKYNQKRAAMISLARLFAEELRRCLLKFARRLAANESIPNNISRALEVGDRFEMQTSANPGYGSQLTLKLASFERLFIARSALIVIEWLHRKTR